MDKEKIKHVIAREGLILLAIILLGVVFVKYTSYPNWLSNKKIVVLSQVEFNSIEWKSIFADLVYQNMKLRKARIYGLGIIVLFYSLIRFIIWALRTLRER